MSRSMPKARISIHTLRVEGDLAVKPHRNPVEEISIHTLRVEGDFLCAGAQLYMVVFLSRTCRRMEKFCGRFSLAGKEEIRSKTHNMRLYSAKMCTTNLTQTVCLRLCGELFCFSGLTRSFSWTHGSGACPAPASSTAFSGQRPGPAGTAPCGCWPCPRLKNGGIQSHSSADQRRLPPE